MWISNIAAWQQSPVCHVPYERFFFMSVPTECSVSDVHWRRSLACVSARCTFVLFFVLNHYSGGLFSFCEGVCLCVFSPGEKGNYLAISVFIYNDWAFAIQIVSLYMEYEYIWLYMYETWMWLGFFVYCMTLLSYAPLKRSERGVFESRSPAACQQTHQFPPPAWEMKSNWSLGGTDWAAPSHHSTTEETLL